MSQSPPPAPEVVTRLEITAAMGALLMNALGARKPVAVAYADAEGRPHLSYRGTTQRLSDTQLALWARNPEGGIVKAVAQRPAIALLYSDFTEPARRVILSFTGRGRVEPDEAVRRRVFDNSPELERNQDPQRRGVAIVIDLDEVNGVMDGRILRMRRA